MVNMPTIPLTICWLQINVQIENQVYLRDRCQNRIKVQVCHSPFIPLVRCSGYVVLFFLQCHLIPYLSPVASDDMLV